MCGKRSKSGCRSCRLHPRQEVEEVGEALLRNLRTIDESGVSKIEAVPIMLHYVHGTCLRRAERVGHGRIREGVSLLCASVEEVKEQSRKGQNGLSHVISRHAYCMSYTTCMSFLPSSSASSIVAASL